MANPPPSSMTLSDNDRMMEMINGYWITQIVNAAATYALADHLAEGPATAAKIAEMANTDPSATFRLLRACASLGLATYDGESRFTATSLLNTLRTDNPQSLRDLAMLMAGPANWLPWGRFVNSVKTGQPQAVAALGKMVFEYIAERPAESETFTRAMKRAITFVTEEVARILEARSATVIADIGGAGGSLLHAVLQANPAPRGIVFDLPNIAEIAKGAAAEIGLQRRVTAVGGDFLEAVPRSSSIPEPIWKAAGIAHGIGARLLHEAREALPPTLFFIYRLQLHRADDEPPGRAVPGCRQQFHARDDGGSGCRQGRAGRQ